MNVLDYDACAFSADGLYVAAAIGSRFIIKKTPFAGSYVTDTAAYPIDRLRWNTASDLVLCSQLNSGVFQVYNVRAKSWMHTFTCGYFKIIAVEWIGPKKLLLTLQFHMALAVFDLLKNSVVYIEVPKPIWPCAVFDSDGTQMFVLSKINGFEKLLMMHSRSIDRIIYIQDMIGSCDGLNKSPDNRFLCVFNRQKLVILNFNSGNVIGSVEYLLFNSMCWAPNGEYLALGCSLGNIVVLASSNEFNIEFQLCRHSVTENYDFFLESNQVLIKTKPTNNFLKAVLTKVESITWSYDCSYFSSFEVNSKFLCIWKKDKLICAIEFSSIIKDMQWCPSENKLSVAYGLSSVFFWVEKYVPKLMILPKLADGTCLLVSSISWSFNNRDMILSDGKKCLLFTI